MAAHRGLKLARSRKRKPGTGHYGLYGLTDSSGKPLFGIGDDGLTATPEIIRDYLRKAEVSTWAQSADVTPDRQRATADVATDAAPPRDAPASDAPAPASKSKPRSHAPEPFEALEPSAAGAGKPDTTSRRRPKLADPAPEPRISIRKIQKPELKSKPTPEPTPEPVPPPPVLKIRPAAKSDLVAISRLAGMTGSDVELDRRFAALKRAGGGVLVADKGGMIGCAALAVVLSLRRASIGRVTLLVVAEDERRRGTGRELIEAVSSDMAAAGCETCEAMSDIEVRNANGFFRALGFEQQSYRFVRENED